MSGIIFLVYLIFGLMNDRAKEINKIFGIQLRDARREKGLTQHELWLLSDIATSQIGKIERGVANPTLATMVALADALKVPVGELMSPKA
ncbi:helix-turn-helix transcriptional regulator [Mucilaginibacter sp. 21P]|uniref:helix-turn-helix domain-containing protein n=1 Tax=Mucilaginibacter sp. 21P TaxID=2778902 RepID=UPI001C586D55|nr:helix-turn-helix transcriptional regulator [Mucilaginibacter sp. 21P]QXV63746.1 helix-turn-helix transcriptional regulator [Mucilaginibacter sp. 21P]